MRTRNILVSLLGPILAGAFLGPPIVWGRQEPAEIQRLTKQLGGEYAAERLAAASALRTIGPAARDAVPALIKALQDRDHDVRNSAAFALGAIGPAAKDAVPALITALEHENSDARRYAAIALARIGPGAKDAVLGLVEALKDEERAVRLYAARALGKIGPAAKDTLPELKELAEEDKDQRVRQAAEQAIEEIQGFAQE